jgi:hypothetical protein
MVGRRLLLLVAVLMGLTALAASIAPRDNSSDGPTTAPGRPPLQATETPAPSLEAQAPAAPEGDTLEETVSAAPGASPTRVRARVGQTLVLDVQGPVLDAVVIEGLDLVRGIAPEAPAHFEIFLDRAGRFPIALEDAGRRVGEIVVQE